MPAEVTSHQNEDVQGVEAMGLSHDLNVRMVVCQLFAPRSQKQLLLVL